MLKASIRRRAEFGGLVLVEMVSRFKFLETVLNLCKVFNSRGLFVPLSVILSRFVLTRTTFSNVSYYNVLS